jgi:hypothetical protein
VSNVANIHGESYAEIGECGGTSDGIVVANAEEIQSTEANPGSMTTDPATASDPGEKSISESVPVPDIRLPANHTGATASSLGSGTSEGAGGILALIVPADLSMGLSVPYVVPQPITLPDVDAPDAHDPDLGIEPTIAEDGYGGSSVLLGSNAQRVWTRAQNNNKRPKVYMDGTIRYAYLTTSDEPEGVAKALLMISGEALWRMNFMPYKWMQRGTWFHIIMQVTS